MTNTRVSVVIPVFNGASFLAAAIESVLVQTSPPDDVVIVDDGSTDASLTVARSFEPRVRTLALEHRGVSAATNAGVGEARGDLISFLDADDLWTPDKLALQVGRMSCERPPDLLFGLARNFRDGRDPEPPMPGISKGTLLLRKSTWARVGGLDESLSLGEFIDWFARATAAGLQAETLPHVLLLRRLHGSNSGIRSAALRSQYALIAKRAIDRRRAGPGPPE